MQRSPWLLRLQRVWDTCTGPSRAIRAPERRRRARMLAALLLILVATAALLTLVIPWIVAPTEHAANRKLMSSGLVVIALGLSIYGISRTRYYETAAWLTVFSALASVSLSLYISQGTLWQTGAPYYLALAALLATLLLSLGAAGLVVTLCLLLPMVYFLTIPSFSAVALSSSIVFLGILSCLLLVTALVRHQDIVQIRAQAEALMESEERYRTLFEATFEGLALHAGGRIMDVNEAMARMWGAQREELVGLGLGDLVTPESRSHLLAALASGRHATKEAVAQRAGGKTFAMEFITKPYRYKGRSVWVTGIRDVTQRKEAEAARLKARELEATNERLVEIDRFKTHILNVTSHELNTPITPLRMQVHLLKTEGFGRLNRKQRSSVEILDRNLRRLALLVKDILDVSRLEAGRLRMHPRRMELTDVVQSVARTFQAEAEKRNVRLQVCTTMEDWIEADPKRMEQALMNLLSNALKFTPSGGTITLETQGHYKHVVIEIRDTGIGLTQEQRSRLFRPFDPVHDLQGDTESGLGLYITKGIVEQHGGRIEVESGAGQGCRFRIDMPRRFPAENRSPAPVVEAGHGLSFEASATVRKGVPPPEGPEAS